MEKKDKPKEVPLDPKKFFDEKEYNTIIVKKEGFSKKETALSEVVKDILEKELGRPELESIFTQIKEGAGQNVMVEAIQQAKTDADKAKLCAACWECGLDFRNYFLFFAGLSCSNDFLLAMEALTVVENIEGKITEEELKKAMMKAQNCNSPNKEIISDLIDHLKSRMG